VLTENAAILQYIGDRRPEAGVAPTGFGRYQLAQWLSYVGTELHKVVFQPLLAPAFPAEAKEKAKASAPERFAYLNDHLTGRDWLLDAFSVADAYLAAVLNWNRAAVKLDLSAYPALLAYQDRLFARPSVQKALGEEFALYQAA
jgi:glutathione S-transferase